MDIPYRISGGVVSGSAALASPPLLPRLFLVLTYLQRALEDHAAWILGQYVKMVLARDPLFRRIFVFKTK